ncbi:MAG: Ig-like domain-containing protein [Armatimonadetes bacterium]|nr:Ig-like domain-containing protein [Armatimonadota bacterium]
MRALLLLAAVACLCQTALAQSDRVGLYRVEVSVTPRQVPADGKSQARLRVEVRDARGRAAAEGTQVVVHTSLGLLSLSSTGQQVSLTTPTAGGFAILYLSSDDPGTATVTVQVSGSRSLTYVDFLPEGESVSPEARVVDVSGGWVGYSMQLGLLEARDRARVKLGKLTIESGSLIQFNVESLAIRAQDVVIRRGDGELAGEDLYFDLLAKRGVLRRFGKDGLERVFFDAVGLRPLETEWELPADAFKVDKRESDAWMVARSISFFLHEKIVLRHASLWMQEQKVFSFPPYWIIGLPGYSGLTNSEALGMTTGGGLAVDFPFFYRVTDRSTGAIRIQHGAMSGGVMSRDGWSLAVSEEYRDGAGVDGSVVVAGLPRSDWGFEWRDARPVLGDGYSYFTFAMPDHRSIFADSSAYHRLAGGRLNLQAYYARPEDAEDTYGLVGDWLMDPRPIGSGPVTYRLGTSLGMRRYTGESDPLFVNELYSELNLGMRSWGKHTRVSPMITNIYSWDTGGYRENSVRGQVRMDHQFARTFSVGLNYSAELRSGNPTTSGLRQLVGVDARANQAQRWASYLSGTYDITSSDLYGMLNFDYFLSKQWRAGLLATYYDFSGTEYQDLEFSVGRVFGSREVSLAYSTYTQRISLNLGGFTLK